jgi:hypothetical protein
MSRRIFPAGKRVQRFGLGGFFKSLSDPAASAFNSDALLAAPQYVPETPAYIPIEALKPATPTAAATPKLDDKMLEKLKDVHSPFARVMLSQNQQALAQLEKNTALKGELYLFSPEGKELARKAGTLDQAALIKAQNAKKINDERAKSKNKDSYYISQAGTVSVLNDKTWDLQEISVQELDKAMAMGYRPLTGNDEWRLREQELNNISDEDPNADKRRSLLYSLAQTEMKDYDELMTMDESREQLTKYFEGLGKTTNDKTKDAFSSLSGVLGVMKSTRNYTNNHAQLKAALSILTSGEGAVDRRAYHAFVNNYIKENGGYAKYAADGKDKEGKTRMKVVDNADVAFGRMLVKMAEKKRETSAEEKDDFSIDANSNQQKDAGPLNEALFNLQEGIQQGDMSRLSWSGWGNGDTFIGVPSTKLVFTSKAPEGVATNQNKEGTAYIHTLQHDPFFQRAQGDIYLKTGEKLPSQLYFNSTRDNRKQPSVVMLPTRDGQNPLNLSTPEARKLQQLGAQIAALQKSGKKAEAEAKQALYKQEVDRLGLSYKFFTATTITGYMNKTEYRKLDQATQAALNTGTGESGERSIAYNKDKLLNTPAIKDRFGWVEDVKNMVPGRSKPSGVAAQQFFTTEVYAPINTGDTNGILQTDAALGGSNMTMPAGMFNISREAGGKMPATAPRFESRAADKPTFSFKPITLQDID